MRLTSSIQRRLAWEAHRPPGSDNLATSSANYAAPTIVAKVAVAAAVFYSRMLENKCNEALIPPDVFINK